MTVHWSEKAVEEMTDRDWRIFKEDFMIVIRGQNVPMPMRSWQESELPERILEAVEEAGYKAPSPVHPEAEVYVLSSEQRDGALSGGPLKMKHFRSLLRKMNLFKVFAEPPPP